MSGKITPFNVALGVGPGGALVDVTAYLELSQPVTITRGRQDQFRDPQAGTFTFLLNNHDGRFTPGNLASPYWPATVQEGTALAVQIGSRVMAGQVIAPEFLSGIEGEGWLQITGDDLLGTAARSQIVNGLADGLLNTATPIYRWRCDDPATATGAAETTGHAIGPMVGDGTGVLTFGVTNPTLGMPSTIIQFGTVNTGAKECDFGTTGSWFSPAQTDALGNYTVTSGGFWNGWYWLDAPTTTIQVIVGIVGIPAGTRPGMYQPTTGLTPYLTIAGSRVTFGWGGDSTSTTVPVTTTAPHFYSLGVTAPYTSGSGYLPTITLYIDGVQVGVQPFASGYLPTWSASNWALVDLEVTTTTILTSGTSAGWAARISHSVNRPHEELAPAAALTSEAAWFTAVAAAIPGSNLATLPTDLSTAPTGWTDPSGGSALDALSRIVRTEQAHAFPVTSGTLTAPTVALTVLSRTRPTTPTLTFDAVLELAESPQFARDISNVLAQITVQGVNSAGTTVSTIVTDPNPVAAATFASNGANSDSVLLSQQTDQALWGQDRIWRGKYQPLRVASILVDAMTTPTNRAGDLLGLQPGAPIRITNLPVALYGVTMWDGWVQGVDESHGVDQHQFRIYLAPVLSTGAVSDTMRADAGTSMQLSAACAATDSTITVASVDGTGLSTTADGWSIQIDAEVMAVTAITGTGPWTLTVTRAQGVAPAAAHAAGAVVEISPTAVAAY